MNTRVNVKICGRRISMLVDSGSDVNIIDEETFRKFVKTVKLSKTNKKLYAYISEKPLKLCGKFSAVTESKNKVHLATYYVVNGKGVLP